MLRCDTCNAIIPTIVETEGKIEKPYITPEGDVNCTNCAAVNIGRKTHAFVQSIREQQQDIEKVTPEWIGYVQEHRSPMKIIRQFIRNLVR